MSLLRWLTGCKWAHSLQGQSHAVLGLGPVSASWHKAFSDCQLANHCAGLRGVGANVGCFSP